MGELRIRCGDPLSLGNEPWSNAPSSAICHLPSLEISRMPPAVSIILPTYNRLTYLQEAVQSVLDQTAGDWELIVVDDGSTDESVAWLESLGEPRVSVVREQHTGNRSALRNVGVERARAEWIAFLDSDDRWHPEKLQRQLALQRANPRYRW